MTPPLAILIVTHNSAMQITPCVQAAVRANAEVVVIDNASSDSTVCLANAIEGVRVLANNTNQGFAAAVNQGVAATSAPFILLLNPDTILVDDPAPLLAAFEQPDVGAAAGRLLDDEGGVQVGMVFRRLPTPAALAAEVLGVNRLWPGNPINRRYRCLQARYDAPGDVEQPAGAFFMFRRAVWLALSGFDESFYPVWFEDVDFCCRILKLGSRIRYVPEVSARHSGAHSVSRVPRVWRQLYWYSNLLRYASKHFRPGAFRGVCVALAVGALVRIPVEMLAFRSVKPIALYAKVMSFAGYGLWKGRPKAVGWSPILVQ
jgi:N-acetylglucosaminyl-diphospho-decaprenol L-rhamnosyltransferase